MTRICLTGLGAVRTLSLLHLAIAIVAQSAFAQAWHPQVAIGVSTGGGHTGPFGRFSVSRFSNNSLGFALGVAYVSGAVTGVGFSCGIAGCARDSVVVKSGTLQLGPEVLWSPVQSRRLVTRLGSYFEWSLTCASSDASCSRRSRIGAGMVAGIGSGGVVGGRRVGLELRVAQGLTHVLRLGNRPAVHVRPRTVGLLLSIGLRR